MSFIENESATFEDLCLRLERDFSGSPAAAMLHRFYEWRRYTLTLQREADGLREALTKLREACEPFQTEVSSWAPDFPPNGVALGDHDPALSVTWGDLLLLDIAAMDARAALNVPPQAPALEDNNGI